MNLPVFTHYDRLPRTAAIRLRIQIEYACIHSEYAPAGRQPLTRWRRELDWLKGNGVT